MTDGRNCHVARSVRVHLVAMRPGSAESWSRRLQRRSSGGPLCSTGPTGARQALQGPRVAAGLSGLRPPQETKRRSSSRGRVPLGDYCTSNMHPLPLPPKPPTPSFLLSLASCLDSPSATSCSPRIVLFPPLLFFSMTVMRTEHKKPSTGHDIPRLNQILAFLFFCFFKGGTP